MNSNEITHKLTNYYQISEIRSFLRIFFGLKTQQHLHTHLF